MAANRSQTMAQAVQSVWARGGAAGFFQGLIPWAWIEASTKGAVLVFAATEIETYALSNGVNAGAAGLLGGMTGGIAQAYATMGEHPASYLPVFSAYSAPGQVSQLA
jgi:hypothetical protein